MKTIHYISLSLAVLLTISCNSSDNKKANTTTPTNEIATKKIAHVSMDIEGMTCEIGCAKIIESKVSKLQGIQFSHVNFETKKGVFSYDSNSISKKEIVEKINGIAGGDLYNVTNTTILDSIPNPEI